MKNKTNRDFNSFVKELAKREVIIKNRRSGSEMDKYMTDSEYNYWVKNHEKRFTDKLSERKPHISLWLNRTKTFSDYKFLQREKDERAKVDKMSEMFLNRNNEYYKEKEEGCEKSVEELLDDSDGGKLIKLSGLNEKQVDKIISNSDRFNIFEIDGVEFGRFWDKPKVVFGLQDGGESYIIKNGGEQLFLNSKYIIKTNSIDLGEVTIIEFNDKTANVIDGDGLISQVEYETFIDSLKLEREENFNNFCFLSRVVKLNNKTK